MELARITKRLFHIRSFQVLAELTLEALQLVKEVLGFKNRTLWFCFGFAWRADRNAARKSWIWSLFNPSIACYLPKS